MLTLSRCILLHCFLFEYDLWQMQKMRSSGGAQIDTEAVKTAAKHLKVVKMQVEDLKDQTLHTKDKVCIQMPLGGID